MLWRQWLLVTVCALALIPVIVAVVQHGVGGWVPDGDDAWVARRTMQVVSTQPPLIGQESTASDMPLDAGLSHLGPASYYIMAVPYALTGWSPVGLSIGAGLIVGAASIAIIVLAQRNAGDRGTVAAGIVVAGLAARLGQEWFVRPTSSALAVVPLAACLVGLWAYLRRDRMGLLVTLVFGSFAMQTSLVVLPLAASVILAALVVVVVRRVRTGSFPVAGWGWLVVGAVGATWIPPLIDQFTRSPGNLADFFDYLYSDASGRERTGKVTSALGAGPALATVVDAIANPLGLGGRRIQGQGIWVVTQDQLGLIAPAAFGALVALSVWWAASRRRISALVLFALAAATTVAAIAFFSRRPAATLFNPLYFVLWIQAVAVAWWLAIVLCGVDAMSVAARSIRTPGLTPPERRARLAVRQRSVFTGCLVVMAGLVGLGSFQPIPRAEAARVRTLSAQLRDVLPAGTYEVEGKGLVAWVSTAKGIGTDLIAHGYDMRFTEFGGMVDERQRRATRGGDQIFVVAREGGDIAPADRGDLSLIAEFQDDEAQILVFFVPGGDYASLCEQISIVRSSPISGVVDGDGTIMDPSGLARLLGSFKLDQLADDVGDERYLAAVEQLRATREDSLFALESTEPGTPGDDLFVAPETIEAIVTIFGTYGERCQVAPPPRT